MPDVDYVAGVPDSGLPHGIGYANYSHKTFARPFVKYTPTWALSGAAWPSTIRKRASSVRFTTSKTRRFAPSLKAT